MHERYKVYLQKHSMGEKRKIFGEEDISRALDSMVAEILVRNQGLERTVLVGIRTGGGYLARRISERIFQSKGIHLPVGIIDITFYRDDWTRLSQYPEVKRTEILFPIESKRVLLVDDVLFTGRTIRAAMDALMELGRPEKIELAVLIDRGHREFPIRADYVGITLPTSKQESVNVHLKESAAEECVVVEADKYR